MGYFNKFFISVYCRVALGRKRFALNRLLLTRYRVSHNSTQVTPKVMTARRCMN